MQLIIFDNETQMRTEIGDTENNPIPRVDEKIFLKCRSYKVIEVAYSYDSNCVHVRVNSY